MAFKRKTRRPRRSRRTRRRTRKLGRSSNKPIKVENVGFANVNPRPRNMVRNLGYLFPQKLRVSLPYNDYASISTSSGTNFYNMVFKGNDLVDPMQSGGTVNGQPAGRDQLGAIYRAFRVNASAIRLFITSTGTTSTGMCVVRPTTISTADTTTFADAPYNLLEQKLVKRADYGANGSGNQMVNMSHYVKSKSMFPLYWRDHGTAGVGADQPPSYVWYWNISFFDHQHDTVSGSIAVAVDVKVDYYCEWTQPNTVTPS